MTEGAGIPKAHLPPSPWEPLKEPMQPKYSKSCHNAILPRYTHLTHGMSWNSWAHFPPLSPLTTTFFPLLDFWKKTPMEGDTRTHLRELLSCCPHCESTLIDGAGKLPTLLKEEKVEEKQRRRESLPVIRKSKKSNFSGPGSCELSSGNIIMSDDFSGLWKQQRLNWVSFQDSTGLDFPWLGYFTTC